MKHLTALVAVCTIAVACTDEPAHKAAPTEPSAAVVPTALVAPALVSTICMSYATEESRLATAVEKAPENQRLKSQHVAIQAAIKDACR